VYFSCLEAAQNTRKHTPPGTVVTLTLEAQAGRLRFALHDDGGGFDPGAVASGHGLTNIHDRIAAVDGHVEITPRPGHGTTVSGSVPWPAAEAPLSAAPAARLVAATGLRR
jgi:signal transduction histidine kinase